MAKGIFFILGCLAFYVTYKKIILVETKLIIILFFISFVLLIWDIYKKRKDIRTPRPVYGVPRPY